MWFLSWLKKHFVTLEQIFWLKISKWQNHEFLGQTNQSNALKNQSCSQNIYEKKQLKKIFKNFFDFFRDFPVSPKFSVEQWQQLFTMQQQQFRSKSSYREHVRMHWSRRFSGIDNRSTIYNPHLLVFFRTEVLNLWCARNLIKI